MKRCWNWLNFKKFLDEEVLELAIAMTNENKHV
jgi:hypothetical protein